MQIDLSPLTLDTFLSNYWQKKPVVIKEGVKNFIEPLDAEQLAGLAAEENIESRLIYQRPNATWQAESGPFENYDKYGDSHWTLVVQSVNHWIAEVQSFARLFDFIPQWRFDDVMVSFAAKNGGVGPHIDNYDVFICQGSGNRHWRVGDKNDNNETIIAHEKLRHTEAFDAIIDEIVEAGDILYIPPGFPHEGISLDSSMSFSIGYKATNSTELLSGFADYLIDFKNNPELLSDRPRQLSCYGQIDTIDFNRLKELLKKTVDNNDTLSDFLGIYLSQSRAELDLANDDLSYAEWLTQFKTQPLNKLYALKTLYLSSTITQGVFYLDGEKQQLINISEEDIATLCDYAIINYDSSMKNNFLDWLWRKTNQGYWYFD